MKLEKYYKWRYRQNKKLDFPKEDRKSTKDKVYYLRDDLFHYCKSIGVYSTDLKNWRKWNWIPGKREGIYWVAPRVTFRKFLGAILYPPMPEGYRAKDADLPLFRDWHLSIL